MGALVLLGWYVRFMAATLLNDQENKDMPGRAKGGKIKVRAGASQP